MAAHVLIVDDDPVECRHVETIVRNLGHQAETAMSGEAALTRLARADAAPICAMILDLVMPDLDGMAVLERLSRRSHAIPVIVQTAATGADAGAAAMRAGAFDFITKPAAPERVRVSLANALRIGALESELLRARLGRSGTLGLSDIAMHSPAMERAQRLAERAARSNIPVLIEGEHGVGKELLARAIHASSPRRSRPFVKLDCPDLCGDDLEALLSGAPARGADAPLRASGGTVFLDEIGTLPPETQKTLSRTLAERRTGGSGGRAERSDVRLVAATSRRLIELVSDGTFEEELFYRLNVLPIWLPPLRERQTDIPNLARTFLARLAGEAGRSFVTGISPAAMEMLVADPWPGNLRELEQAIFRATMLCQGSELSPREFPAIALRSGCAEPGEAPTDATHLREPSTAVAVQEQTRGNEAPPAAPFADIRSPARYGVARLLDERGELRPFEVVEEEVIRFAIDHYRGHMSEVARRLGIGRSTLYRKIKEYGIGSGEPALS